MYSITSVQALNAIQNDKAFKQNPLKNVNYLHQNGYTMQSNMLPYQQQSFTYFNYVNDVSYIHNDAPNGVFTAIKQCSPNFDYKSSDQNNGFMNKKIQIRNNYNNFVKNASQNTHYNSQPSLSHQQQKVSGSNNTTISLSNCANFDNTSYLNNLINVENEKKTKFTLPQQKKLNLNKTCTVVEKRLCKNTLSDSVNQYFKQLKVFIKQKNDKLNCKFDFPKIFTLTSFNDLTQNFNVDLFDGNNTFESCFFTHSNLQSDIIEYTDYFLSKNFPIVPEKNSNVLPNNISGKKPLPSLEHFLKAIFKKTKISISTLVTALIFLKKLKFNHKNCKGSEGSAHRLILASLIVASKYLFDDTYDNKAWQIVSENLFCLKDINKMEMEFLTYLNYELLVTWEDWVSFCEDLEIEMKAYYYKLHGNVERAWKGPLHFEFKIWDEVDEMIV
ncbi:hypothetical protein HK099_004037 [Clydaea vesicula]|uniref:Cyclin N-terminal domain-containing protein n=1 Tax=Clydaea vesicula TaxID=447962 RepID=A0AAD5U183_9FUNG|nr:hypothetical protein HK099_004037 [Clydaea vesicula]KAJ3382696.1 hypothetical protein HDU92_004634 [Lobulomyces angularis]